MRLLLWTTLLLACVGCADNTSMTTSPLVVSDLPRGQWSVTAVDTDLGHFTWDDEEHGMYHTHVIGIECTRGNQRVTLLYEDSLPVGLTIAVGNQLTIKPKDSDVEYDTDWGGFWISNLEIALSDT